MISKYIVRPYHTPIIKVTTDSSKILNALCLQYGNYISGIKLDDCFAISVLVDHEHKREFILKYEDKHLYTDNPLQVISNIIYKKTRYDQNIFALHAAAVKCNNMAYVFVAPTTTGKTTLTSYLSSSGFDYITDDCVLLSKDSLYVHPYTIPILLRDGGINVLKEYNRLPENLAHVDIADNDRYAYMPSNYVSEPLPLENIYFICRDETDNKLVDMGISESVGMLMKSPIADYALTPEYFRFLFKLARRGCKRLVYSDMEYVAGILRHEG